MDSLAHKVRKPRRMPNTRRALTPDELSDINAAARSGGIDIVLDAPLLRLHHRNGLMKVATRGGRIASQPADASGREGGGGGGQPGGGRRFGSLFPARPRTAGCHTTHTHTGWARSHRW
ncbi:hypothetical protein [Micromonospora sp. CA-246542]|uniref:hypothetical protein n=1 Tax=Micromonospora sp. CA-246542 TaxID=3239959 RepID=UPI003D91A04C